jgi:hypothetical protein
MVAYNVTLDDTSPVIEYSGTWSEKHDDGENLFGYMRRNVRQREQRLRLQYCLSRFKNEGVFLEDFHLDHNWR